MLWSLSWTLPNTLHLHEASAISKFDTSEFRLDKKLAKHEIIEISWNESAAGCKVLKTLPQSILPNMSFSHDLPQNFRRISQPICWFAIFCKGTAYSRTNCYLLIASYDTSSFNLKRLITFTKFRTLRSSPKLRPWRAKSKIATGFHLRTVAWNVQL